MDSISLTKEHLETIDVQLEMFIKAYYDKLNQPMTTAILTMHEIIIGYWGVTVVNLDKAQKERGYPKAIIRRWHQSGSQSLKRPAWW